MATSSSSAASDQPEEDASELIFPKGNALLLRILSSFIFVLKLAVDLLSHTLLCSDVSLISSVDDICRPHGRVVISVQGHFPSSHVIASRDHPRIKLLV